MSEGDKQLRALAREVETATRAQLVAIGVRSEADRERVAKELERRLGRQQAQYVRVLAEIDAAAG